MCCIRLVIAFLCTVVVVGFYSFVVGPMGLQPIVQCMYKLLDRVCVSPEISPNIDSFMVSELLSWAMAVETTIRSPWSA